MIRVLHATLFLLAVSSDVRGQFFDFFSALQPSGHQTLRPIFQFDVTTKRPTSQTKIVKQDFTTRRPFSFYSEDTNKQNAKNQPVIYDYYSTTIKPNRKTTKSNTRRHYDTNRENTNNNKSNKEKYQTTNNNKSNARNTNQKQQNTNAYNNDRVVFDDGRRNTVLNYDTTRPTFTTKSPYDSYDTNRRTVRPGVRPAVANGPPITNKPATRRPSFASKPSTDDLSVSPELIIGPNEDYMATAEKKRYIDMAEKMCDKYKALDIEEISVIPLVPSPEPYKLNVSKCTPNTSPLIVGGRVVTIQEFRHMALLGWNNVQRGGYSWKCGGSLISNQYVLTAAHCSYQDRDNSVVIGAPRAVQLGSSFLDDPGAVVMKVASVIRHPKYKLPKSYYDIALVKMKNPITFSNVIRPACLGIPPPPGRPIVATGWGRTEFGGDQSQELRSVSLPVWDMTECYNALGTSRKLPEGPSSDSQICAGEKKGGKDTCQGDSGGPAQIQDGCAWRVVAVTSLGRSCGAAQTPALYAKIPRAFVSAVVFGGQVGNNNKQQNQLDQWNNQQPNNQQQNKNQQLWNNQQTNNQQNWNTKQQETTRNPLIWNRNEQDSNKHPAQSHSQQSTDKNHRNEQQWNNNQQKANNQMNTYKQNTQQYNNNNGYSGNNRNDYSVYEAYNQSPNGNNQNSRGQSSVYTTAKPYNQENRGYNGNFGEASSDYQSDGGYYSDSRVWWT